MNICAVRTLMERGFTLTAKEFPLPHEPTSDERYLIRRFDVEQAGAGKYAAIELAECKHCGGFYSATEE